MTEPRRSRGEDKDEDEVLIANCDFISPLISTDKIALLKIAPIVQWTEH